MYMKIETFEISYSIGWLESSRRQNLLQKTVDPSIWCCLTVRYSAWLSQTNTKLNKMVYNMDQLKPKLLEAPKKAEVAGSHKGLSIFETVSSHYKTVEYHEE